MKLFVVFILSILKKKDGNALTLTLSMLKLLGRIKWNFIKFAMGHLVSLLN